MEDCHTHTHTIDHRWSFHEKYNVSDICYTHKDTDGGRVCCVLLLSLGIVFVIVSVSCELYVF
jgi:hypothetical protein